MGIHDQTPNKKHQENYTKNPRKCNLLINITKTEDYDITRNGDDKSNTCKLLGSLLDTEKTSTKGKYPA